MRPHEPIPPRPRRYHEPLYTETELTDRVDRSVLEWLDLPAGARPWQIVETVRVRARARQARLVGWPWVLVAGVVGAAVQSWLRG